MSGDIKGAVPRPGRDNGGDGGTADEEGRRRAEGLSVGWAVFSYLIAGMIAYGGIGWLIGRAVHLSILFPVGMLVGLGISLGYVIYRYGVQGPKGHTKGADR